MKPVGLHRISLSDFQNAFSQALLAERFDDVTNDVCSGFVDQPGFAVYRNTMMQACIDALQANFPAVARLVGEQWFRAAAAVFVRNHLPGAPSLLDYDARFAEFIEGFAPAAELTYLADVARLDRFWMEAHVSADAPCVAPRRVADLSRREMARLTLRPHPSARWRMFTLPIYSIWRGNREDALPGALDEFEWRAEGALIVRPDDVVDSIGIDAAECAFLDACGRGVSLEQAALAALSVDPSADLGVAIERLLGVGAFWRLDESSETREIS